MHNAFKVCLYSLTIIAAIAFVLLLIRQRPSYAPLDLSRAQFDGNPFGIDLGVVEGDWQLELAREAGAGWVRYLVFWRFIEPEPPTGPPEPDIFGRKTGRHRYDWSQLDRAVNLALAKGLQVYLTIVFPPWWANGTSKDCALMGDIECGRPATDPYYYEDFVYNLANHFKGRVRYYCPLNEPNLKLFFNPPPSDKDIRAIYAEQILLRARDAIKAADPNAFLCGPELTTLGAKSDRWDRNWLDPLLRYYGECFDVITMTGFMSPAAKVKREVVDRVHKIMSRHGLLGAKPFWLVEVAWNTRTFREGYQAENLYAIYAEMFKNSGWWKRTFWHGLMDSKDGVWQYGLLRWTNGDPPYAPKKAFRVYQRMTGARR